jgi:hypothetical protein
MSVHAQRLDDVVHYLEVRGEPAAGELERSIDRSLDAGARWLIVDLDRATLPAVPEAPLAVAGCELRERRGELILVSASPVVAESVARYEIANRPAVAASLDQALMILKLLRPKTAIRRPRRRITSMSLPAIEPPATA